MGDAPALRIAKVFCVAGIPIELCDDVTGVLWGNLIVDCAYNTVSALSQVPYECMIEVEGVSELMPEVVRERRVVAERLNVRLPDAFTDEVLAIAGAILSQFSSMAHDLARGRRTENGSLNGFVVRAGEAWGVAARQLNSPRDGEASRGKGVARGDDGQWRADELNMGNRAAI